MWEKKNQNKYLKHLVTVVSTFFFPSRSLFFLPLKPRESFKQPMVVSWFPILCLWSTHEVCTPLHSDSYLKAWEQRTKDQGVLQFWNTMSKAKFRHIFKARGKSHALHFCICIENWSTYSCYRNISHQFMIYLTSGKAWSNKE